LKRGEFVQELTREFIVKMPKCSYCGKMYEPPRGLTLVLKDGSLKYLCSAKCRKNMKMKRRKVRWIRGSKEVKEEKKEGKN
jgi:ribosomal protein L24E